MTALVNRARILIVDDDPDMRLLIRALLGKTHRVQEAESGEDGLTLASRETPDLILLDWDLPGLNGLAVLERLQAKPALSTVPVLIVSARTGTDESVAAFGAGAFDFIRKPFAPDELVARVEAILRRTRPAAPTVVAKTDDTLDSLSTQPEEDTLAGERPEGTHPVMSSTEQVHAMQGSVYADKYRVHELLGSGGTALVFRVEHMLLGTELALKVLRADRQTRSQRERFLREARVVSRLKHPGIVPLRDFGALKDGELYLVMDFCPGMTLADWLRARGPLPAKRALAIAAQILEALGYAHEQGVVHRDVKPENVVFLDMETDRVALLDFGLASTDTDAELGGRRLTRPGSMLGTPLYMSPEHVVGGDVDVRSDLFSVAAVVYELIGARPPHDGDTIQELISAILTETPTPLEGVPPALNDVLLRALAKKPDDRYASAAELATALREAIPE